MSTRIIAQATLRDVAIGAELESIVRDLEASGQEIQGAVESHVGRHLPLSVGGGELTWDLLLEDDDAVAALCARVEGAGSEGYLASLGGAAASLADRIVSVEAAIPEPLDGRIGRPGLVGIKRTLWLRVEPAAPQDARARFEQETPLLARAVPAIRNWCWSRIRDTAPRPMALDWTHLWEQEFESVDGLEQDYMSSPAHWGFVDRWFDPEMPERIVDLGLAHLACPEHAPVLSWAMDVDRGEG